MLVAAVGLSACTGDDASSAGDATETGAGASATTDTGTTSTTGGSTTSSTGAESETDTTGESTGSTSTGTTTSTSTTTTTTSTTTGGAAFPWDGVPPGLAGCTLQAPAGTSVEGESSHGPFSSEMAYFGLITYDFGDGLEVVGAHVVLLSQGSDPGVELVGLAGETGQVLRLWPQVNRGEDLLGTHAPGGRLTKDGMDAYPAAQLVLDDYAGGWDEVVPDDPPRLLGSLSWEPGGAFDAVYCDSLDTLADPNP